MRSKTRWLRERSLCAPAGTLAKTWMIGPKPSKPIIGIIRLAFVAGQVPNCKTNYTPRLGPIGTYGFRAEGQLRQEYFLEKGHISRTPRIPFSCYNQD